MAVLTTDNNATNLVVFETSGVYLNEKKKFDKGLPTTSVERLGWQS
jgi:hypothetical protein